MMSLSAEQIEINEISENLEKSKNRPSIESRYKFFYNSIALNNSLLPEPSLLGVKNIGSYSRSRAFCKRLFYYPVKADASAFMPFNF